MARVELHIDYAEVGRILKSPSMADAVGAAASAVQASYGGDGRVFVDRYTTDRAAAAVTVVKKNAEGSELLTGELLSAARRVGLEVRG